MKILIGIVCLGLILGMVSHVIAQNKNVQRNSSSNINNLVKVNEYYYNSVTYLVFTNSQGGVAVIRSE